MKIYRFASIGAVILAPSASAIALFMVAKRWLIAEYATSTAMATIGAIVIAVGLELVGFLAGHMTADSLNQMGVNVRLWSPVFFLLYVIFGTAAVTGWLPIHFASFAITFIAYLIYSVYSEIDEEKAKERAEWRWKLAEKSKDKEARRQAKLAQATVQPVKVDKVDSRQPHGVDGLTPAQLRVYMAIKDNPGATYEEIGQQLGVSRQAVGKHARNMNGLIKELRS